MNKRLGSFMLAGICSACAGVAFAATDFASLQAEINAVSEGGTVYLENDIDYSGRLSIVKDLTIAGAAGKACALKRAANYEGGSLLLLDEGNTSVVTFRDITIDGNKAAGKATEWLMLVKDGEVILDSGATICNHSRAKDPGALLVRGANGHCGIFRMKEGSAVKGCETVSYGAAFLVGNGGNSNDGKLIIEGGEISGCADHYPNSAADYGGAVYLYGAGSLLKMTGGKISANTSDNAVAGVVVYTGCIDVSGTAEILGNTGARVDDVSIVSKNATGYGNCWVQVSDNYAGWMTVALQDGNGVEGKFTPHIYTSAADAVRKGFVNIRLQGTDLCCNGEELVNHWYPTWRKRIAQTTGENLLSFSGVSAKLKAVDTITLYANLDLSSYMGISGRDLTFTSGTGGPYAIRPAQTGTYLFWVENATLRFENVVLDGRADEGFWIGSGDWQSLVPIGTNGKVYLNKGAVIRNAQSHTCATAVDIHYAGAYLEMNEGAKITGVSSGNYAMAVRVGCQDKYAENPPCFVMNGGEISGCSCTAASDSDGIGGAVYVWGGALELKGGLITGNTAICPSGVNVYCGTVDISGSIEMYGNSGTCPDLYVGKNGLATLTGAFRGKVGVSNVNQVFDKEFRVSYVDGASGAGCFFAASPSAAADLIAYAYKPSHKLYWGRATGWVNGIGFDGRYEDVDARAALLPTEVDLDAGVEVCQLKGAALSLGGSLAIKVEDEAKWRAENADRLPLVLVEGVDGALTGNWTFDLPEAKKGRWKVVSRKTENGTDYLLDWRASGLTLLIR